MVYYINMNNVRNIIIRKMIEDFLRVKNKFNALEKIPMDYGTGELLYRSEVNTLVAIGKHKRTNVTELALRPVSYTHLTLPTN